MAVTLIGLLQENFPKTPLGQTVSKYRDFAVDISGRVSYAINGVAKVLSSGSLASLASSEVAGAFAAMSNSPIGALASMATPLGTAFSIGSSIVGFFSNLFGGSPPDLSAPDIEGYNPNELLEAWLNEDRAAILAGRIYSGERVAAKDSADVKNTAELLADDIPRKLLVALISNRGKRINPARHRQLALAVSYIGMKQLRGIVESRDMENLALLIAYGLPRVQLREALSYYGLGVIAETAWHSDGRRGDGTGPFVSSDFWRPYFSDHPIPKNWKNLCFEEDGGIKCMIEGDSFTINSYFNGVAIRYGCSPHSTPGAGKKRLCGQGPLGYYKHATQIILPKINLNPLSGRYEVYQQVDKLILQDEIDYYSTHNLDISIRAGTGDTFSWTYGRGSGPNIRWPTTEKAIHGLISLCKFNTDYHNDYSIQLSALESEVKRVAVTRTAIGKVSSKLSTGRSIGRSVKKIGRFKAAQSKAGPVAAIAAAALALKFLL